MNASELQVWDNAAFDSDEVPMKASWSSLHTVFEDNSESLDSHRSKENLSPVMANSPVSAKYSIPIKPLHANGVLGNSQRKPSKLLAKKKASEQEDERKIDAEIEEIEKEIKRLSSRLEALRLEKAERIAKTTIEKRGRAVPAKFMEAKQSAKKIEETTPLSSSVKSKFNRRGVSLGPSEIFAEAKFRPPGKPEMTPGPESQSVKKIEEPSLSSSVKSKINRRGMSLGPSEIFATARFRPPGKLETTAGLATQSRRKSCFLQLQDIEESKSAISERRKNMTVSPKSRRTLSKIESQKQAATTTVGSNKLVKKDSSLIQPRKLFGEKEKPISTKKPLKPGRVIASRYNVTSSNQSCGAAIEAARKRSLPENGKEDGGKKARGSEGVTDGGRVKKRWEIPSEIAMYERKEEEEEEEKKNALLMTDSLPKIKTTRCVEESPRGSGPAKRVAELKGKKRSYFCPDNEDDEDDNDEGGDGINGINGSACGALSFAEREGNNDEDEDDGRLVEA